MRQRIVVLAGALLASLALGIGKYLQSDQLPIPRCIFLRFTGYPCPFCGNTRSFMEAAKGKVSEAFVQAPLGVLVYFATWWVLGWCLLRILHPEPPDSAHKKLPRSLFYGVAGVILACWLYRLAKG